MKLSNTQFQAIVEKFSTSIQRRKPVVFCVQCGSTSVDQNFINELRCYECGNSLAWNGYRFSISREQEFDDISSALDAVLRDEVSDWHIEMEQTVGNFAKSIISDCVSSGKTPIMRIGDIEKQWDECKQKIDGLIARRKNEI